jgi:hypothetical protein
MFSMKETNIPKGVRFSFFIMTFPLLFSTGYLALMAPLVSAGAGIIEPHSFASIARTCVRLLALNISFIVSSLYYIILIGWCSLWISLCYL